MAGNPVDFGMHIHPVGWVVEALRTCVAPTQSQPKENYMLLPVLLLVGAIATTLSAPIVVPAVLTVAAVSTAATVPVVAPVAGVAYIVAHNKAPAQDQ